MALTKRSNQNTTYLQIKHFSIWKEIKQHVEGCETLQVPNPKTGEKVTKYGYRFDDVEGFVSKLEWKDTGAQYATRYFGYKMTMIDPVTDERFVLDMPYDSQIMRRFLRAAQNINWSVPLTISAFKGRKESPTDPDSTGIWFRQRGETVKPYFTREDPHGMPEATQDPASKDWDFRPQNRFLMEQLKAVTIPAIEKAAAFREAVPHDDGEQEPPNNFEETTEECPF